MEQSQTSQPATNDVELLKRHLQGDRQAFALLVEQYQRELYSFLFRYTGNAALADDVFQETFLQLHLSAGTFDLSKPLRPWLFTIAANKARDAARARSRRSAASIDAPIGGDDDASYAERIPDDIPAPDETLSNQQTRQAVQTIVSEMPEHLRAVLVLSYFNEFAYKEIADILGVPLGTVKSRLHAAMNCFAEKWKAAARRLGYERNETP